MSKSLNGLLLSAAAFSLFSGQISAMQLSITKTWDGQPIEHDPIHIQLEPLDDRNFQMSVQGSFFDDPPNPGGAPGQPFYGLWEYEVVELFLANDKDQYVEIELCPWGQHIVLLLNGVHNTIRHSLPLEFSIEMRTSNEWQGRALIPIDYLPPQVTKMNAYAIHGSDSKRVYEALYPAPTGKYDYPDFHRLELFQPVDITQLVPSNITEYSPIWEESISGRF